MELTRRQIFGKSLGLGTAVAALTSVGTAVGAVCGVTPAQTPGPFHPANNPLEDQNNDLTFVKNQTAPPLGQVIYLTGQVVDTNCQPVANAMVEIWQAAASGRYNHAADTSGLKLDPNFGYWGEMKTDEKGNFAFKTIIPGHYPADADWTRPPHIHFKVNRLGFREIVTQMYFSKSSFSDPKLAAVVDKLNQEDLILKEIKNRDSVIVDFAEVAEKTVVEFTKLGKAGKFITAKNERLGKFEITLRSVRD